MIPVLISYTYCWTFAFSRSRARPYRSKHFMFLRYTSWLYFDRLYSLFWQNQYVQLFAANQNKPPDVVGILVTNRNKLLRLFADLKTEKGNNICMNEDTVLFMLYSLLFILIVALRNIKFWQIYPPSIFLFPLLSPSNNIFSNKIEILFFLRFI